MSTLTGAAQAQLRQFVEQIERLEEEKKALTADIADKYIEAKGVGFDVKAIRQIVRMRKKSQTERQEEDDILAVYMHALGMLDGTPMGEFIEKQRERDDLLKSARELDALAGTNIAGHIDEADRVQDQLAERRRARNRARDSQVEQIGRAHGMSADVIEATQAELART